MIQQKVLIKEGIVIMVGNDYEIDQYEMFDVSYLRPILPQELYGEEARFLKYENNEIVLDQALKVSSLRAEKLASIRAIRDSKLVEADHAIFKAEDAGQSSTALRAHRAQLRDFTQQFKDENGDPSSDLDQVVVSEIIFPAMP
jgi:hypothetical protein